MAGAPALSESGVWVYVARKFPGLITTKPKRSLLFTQKKPRDVDCRSEGRGVAQMAVTRPIRSSQRVFATGPRNDRYNGSSLRATKICPLPPWRGPLPSLSRQRG